MPIATYEQLAETLPARINDEEQYDSIGARFAELLTSLRRTQAEDRLMDLLGILIADYDRRNAMPPDDSTPAELLQFLIEHSGKTTADLALVFGTRSHVNEALNGRRPISADQARRLGKLFNVRPGRFVR
jgi:HTH-type transcriptional regulator/antitoxin HigA